MAQTKFDRELESFVAKNWPMLLVLGGAALIWYSREKILIEVTRVLPGVMSILELIMRIALIVFFLGIMRRILLYQLEKKRYQYVLILPHVEDEATADTIGRMIRQVHGAGRKPLERLLKGRDWYRLMMVRPEGEGEKVRFYLGGPEDGIRRIVQAFQSLYVHAEVYPQRMEEVPFPHRKAVGGRMVLKRKRLEATLSLARYTKDALPVLLSATETKTWVDVSFSPDNGHRLTRGIQKAEKEIKKRKKSSQGYGLDAFEKEEMKALNKRFSRNETAFQVAVSFASEHYPGVPVIKDLGNIVASIMADVNELRFRRWRHSISLVPHPIYGNMMWTGSELENLVHLPNLTGDKEGKQEKKILFLDKGEGMLPPDVLATGSGIGYLKHPLNTKRLVCMMLDQFRKHGSITGGTGSGKSTVAAMVLQNAIDAWLEDPEQAPGFSLTDPKPELALIMLNRLLKAELEGQKVDWSKIHYIRFRYTEHPPALNLLHRFEGEDIQTVVDAVLSIIKTIIPGAAPQTERVLKSALGTLLSDMKQTHTILSIPTFLTDELFRERVLANLEGSEKLFYTRFWKQEIGDNLENIIQPILNRLDLFRSTSYLRRMYGQTRFSLEVRKWMDQGHLVFYDLSGMSNDDIQLTVGYIMNQYHRIVQQRPLGSKLHMAVIDEAHKVQVPILPKIVAEDRTFGLALWIITQTLVGQLNQSLTNALREIGGNFFVCRQGEENAKLLEGIMQRQFRAQYLQNLPDLTAAIQTQDKINGKTQNVWCTIEVPPLDKYLPDGSVATFGDPKKQEASDRWTYSKIKELEQRGKSAEEIDQEINEFLYGKAAKKVIQAAKEVHQEQVPGPVVMLDMQLFEKSASVDTVQPKQAQVISLLGHTEKKSVEVMKQEELVQPKEIETLQTELGESQSSSVPTTIQVQEKEEQKNKTKEDEICSIFDL